LFTWLTNGFRLVGCRTVDGLTPPAEKGDMRLALSRLKKKLLLMFGWMLDCRVALLRRKEFVPLEAPGGRLASLEKRFFA
jgi:hypothetical protein